MSTVGTMLGLIGHGVIVEDRSAVDQESLPSDLTIDFDLLLNHGDEIPVPPSRRAADVLDPPHTEPRALTIREAQVIRDQWSRALRPVPGSIDPVPGTLPTSAVRHRTANHFETDPDLRRTILTHRGSVCHACEVDGEQKYGAAGLDLMQVHLITPGRFIDEDFRPDILTDLVPLCPNCHVVAHSGGNESLSVADLRRLLRSNGFLRRSVLSDEQIEAEDSARRILGAGS